MFCRTIALLLLLASAHAASAETATAPSTPPPTSAATTPAPAPTAAAPEVAAPAAPAKESAAPAEEQKEKIGYDPKVKRDPYGNILGAPRKDLISKKESQKLRRDSGSSLRSDRARFAKPKPDAAPVAAPVEQAKPAAPTPAAPTPTP